MTHLIPVKNSVSIENLHKVTQSLAMLTHSVPKLALVSFSVKLTIRFNKSTSSLI